MNPSLQTVTVEDLVAAIRRQKAFAAALEWVPPERPRGVTLYVNGAHPGAGASTVAVALMEALPDLDDVTLVELGDDDGFGASGAMQVRADLGLRGWTGGLRGPRRIVNQVVGAETVDDLTGDLVIDVRDRGLGFDLDVLVCRATVPSVRRAESVLMEGHARAVAVVGASKWPSRVRSSMGPRLKSACEAGGVFFFPHEAALEIDGLTSDSLPATTFRVANRLASFLTLSQSVEAWIDENGVRP